VYLGYIGWAAGTRKFALSYVVRHVLTAFSDFYVQFDTWVFKPWLGRSTSCAGLLEA
jgi:hypothetical protein